MRRGAFKKTAAALLAALMLALFCGCSVIADKLNELTSVTEPPEEPEITEAPAETFAPIPGRNPVFEHVSGFISAFSAASEGLTEAASEERDSALLLSCLLHDEATAAQLYATVGMIPFDEDSGFWQGEVAFLSQGHGSLGLNGVFSFEYDDGRTVEGRLSAGTLSCTYDDGLNILIVSDKKGWYVWIGSGQDYSVIEVTESGLRYSDEAAEPGLRSNVFPAAAGRTLTYSGSKVAVSE